MRVWQTHTHSFHRLTPRVKEVNKCVHVNASQSLKSGFFSYRNLFGPVLGSSPAQNPPVIPSMQPGFGGGKSDYSYSDAYRTTGPFSHVAHFAIYCVFFI